jgi:hypothetical protein
MYRYLQSIRESTISLKGQYYRMRFWSRSSFWRTFVLQAHSGLMWDCDLSFWRTAVKVQSHISPETADTTTHHHGVSRQLAPFSNMSTIATQQRTHSTHGRCGLHPVVSQSLSCQPQANERTAGSNSGFFITLARCSYISSNHHRNGQFLYC